MSMNLVTLLYLMASVCFIQALKGLSHPTSSIRGNLFGMAGMAIAGLTTAALIVELSGGRVLGLSWVLVGLLVGGTTGTLMAKRVERAAVDEAFDNRPVHVRPHAEVAKRGKRRLFPRGDDGVHSRLGHAFDLGEGDTDGVGS